MERPRRDRFADAEDAVALEYERAKNGMAAEERRFVIIENAEAYRAVTGPMGQVVVFSVAGRQRGLA